MGRRRVPCEPPRGRHGTVAIVHAKTTAGASLPVIDVTDPAFALADDPAGRARLFAAYEAAERARARRWPLLTRAMLAVAGRRAPLLRALTRPGGPYLDALTTYVLKLGADNLPPPYDSPVDRRLAAAPHVVAMRLRLQQCARLLADDLAPRLAADPERPLHLLNIGGGPAIDSLNALLLLRRERPQLLARPIGIHVLDVDAGPPALGANALHALAAPGAPLDGVDARLEWVSYDWTDPAPLGALLARLPRAAVVAASSEGALFEYGSDEAIQSNLAVLHAHGVPAVVGSVTRDDDARRRAIAAGRFELVPRGLARFAVLAARGGFAIARSEATPLSDQVLLHRQAA